jgi:hypothetical protein
MARRRVEKPVEAPSPPRWTQMSFLGDDTALRPCQRARTPIYPIPSAAAAADPSQASNACASIRVGGKECTDAEQAFEKS